MAMLKRLRGEQERRRHRAARGQMKMLRQLPQLLRFIPGTAQDVRAYFLALQYWLAGSEENLANLVRLLVDRYAAGPRAAPARHAAARPPVAYPDVGLYHPRAAGRIVERLEQLPRRRRAPARSACCCCGPTCCEQRRALRRRDRGAGGARPAGHPGLRQRPRRAAGDRALLHARRRRRRSTRVVSLTGFSLVGGPAYNDAAARPRNRWPSSTCPISPRIRSSSRRSSNGRPIRAG